MKRSHLKKLIRDILHENKKLYKEDNVDRSSATNPGAIKGKARKNQDELKQKIKDEEKERVQKQLALGYLKSLHGFFIKNFFNKKLNEQFDAGITFSTLLNFKQKFDLSKYLPSEKDVGELKKVEASLKTVIKDFFDEADRAKLAIQKNKSANPEKWGNYDKVAITAIDEYSKKIYSLAVSAKKIMDRVQKIAELTKLEDATGQDIWTDYERAVRELTKGGGSSEGGSADTLLNILVSKAAKANK